MARKGGITNKYYKETRGLKASGGQVVPAGTILTRQGHRWQPGINIIGRTSLVAACAGKYISRARRITTINQRLISTSGPKTKV